VPQPELPPERTIDDLLAELDGLIGLDEVKARVHLVADMLEVQRLRAERELPTIETSHHLVFTGNPGTGKTTVARLLAQIYRTLGVVARGHLVETDRSGLVAGFVGQTAPLVTKVFDEADEGMLFIDEAYTLSRGSEQDFGREAIDQIVKLMEDRRDRVVLVVAGYPQEMESFLSTNPGLRSRFPTVIDFPDYSTDQIVQIVDSIGAKQQYVLDDAARTKLHSVLDAAPRSKGFGNARVGRNLYEAAINRHASRVMKLDERTDDVLTTRTADDVPDSVEP
jgi:SpoVK/Ycf46/Vps4 family AAA+-type ATPase